MDFSRIISGVLVAAALFYVGFAINGFHQNQRFVEVRGVAEKIVKSDKSVWKLSYSVRSPEFAQVNHKLSEQWPLVKKFLLAKGFQEKDIHKTAPSISDQEKKGEMRYSGKQTVIVETTDVDRVAQATEDIEPLLSAGILADENSVSFYFTNLDAIKPGMLKEAAGSARKAAEGFAHDANATVGNIKQASQGLFEITAPFNEYGESTIMKKVRVVTQMEFYLK